MAASFPFSGFWTHRRCWPQSAKTRVCRVQYSTVQYKNMSGMLLRERVNERNIHYSIIQAGLAITIPISFSRLNMPF